MKEFFVQQCAEHENKNITASFVVASKQVKPKKSGEPYLALTLADRTGSIEAKMWDGVPEAMGTFEQDDVIKVRGLINKYNGRFQLTIHKIRRMDESEVEYADYLPKTSKDVDVLWQTLGEFVGTFKDENLKALVTSFMADPELERAYKNAPAAKTLHHAFIGGLLDHVVSLFTSCDLVCRNYPSINRDLVLTGAFLHDIGKVHELSYARSFGYTTSGQLLGHMIIELEMLHQKLAAFPDFPPQLKILIEHMIISHHGQYEFGSPKLPMFPEALLLHYMDDLDSKMEAMRAQFERDLSDSDWTAYNPSLGRPLLNTAKFLAPKPVVQQQEAGLQQPEPAPKAEAAAAAAEPAIAGDRSQK
jgi:3'-5' exoribonuclease